MTEAEPQAGERTVEVSPETLARIFPGGGPSAPGPPPSRLRRGITALRVRSRLLRTRLQYRTDDFRWIRCRWASIRLRARLAWMWLRSRGKRP